MKKLRKILIKGNNLMKKEGKQRGVTWELTGPSIVK